METLKEQLEAAYESFGDQFYRCALAVTACGSLAEDAVHNAFAKAMRLPQSPQDIKAYMFRSIRNAAIDLMRKQQRIVPMTAEMIFEIGPDQQSHLDRLEQLEQITHGLAKLSTDERETIVQHLVAHLTFQEIANVRERPLPTITSWYRRGLKKLKQHLHHEGSL